MTPARALYTALFGLTFGRGVKPHVNRAGAATFFLPRAPVVAFATRFDVDGTAVSEFTMYRGLLVIATVACRTRLYAPLEYTLATAAGWEVSPKAIDEAIAWCKEK